MKKQFPSFLAGMLTMALVGAFAIPVLASAGMTITVSPVNVQVNGQTFQPKDANGKDVPIFAYSGTTYAPLRALAEAYGLEVGYDSKTNMATVADSGKPTPTTPSADYSKWSKEDEAAFQEFKGTWKINRTQITSDNAILYDAKYSGGLDKSEFAVYWASISGRDKVSFAKRLSQEYQLKNSTYTVALYFIYSNTDLGYAFSYEDNTALASFSANPFNIHENIND